LGGTYNSKEGVLNHLNKNLLRNLKDGQITHIAIIIDADYREFRSGKETTLKKVTEILKPSKFSIKNPTSSQNGFVFEHSDGFKDFGLWIMANNSDEGMLEDWIKSCISNDEKPLFQEVCNAVGNITKPKFKSHLKTKAEIATWLSWQKTPGHGLYNIMKEQLLDEEHASFKSLSAWLKEIYK
jgi:hypothetical protein